MRFIFIVSTLALCSPLMVCSVPVSVDSDVQVLQSVFSVQRQENDNPNGNNNNGDWLTNALDGIASFVVSKLSDPNNIEEEKKYLKISRLFIEPVVDYHDKAKPNDKVANKILHAIKSFLSSLEKKVNNHPENDVGQLVFAA